MTHQRSLSALTRRAAAFAVTAALLLATAGCSMPLFPDGSEASPKASASPSASAKAQSTKGSDAGDKSNDAGSATPQASEASAQDKAKAILATMSVEQKAGQLMMVPLFAGNGATDVQSLVQNDHVGSVLLLGNWKGGTNAVAQVSSTLQGYTSGVGLLICADQEGGQVQHLTGSGFDTMPSAVKQGQMSVDDLRTSAKTWGGQLKSAGVNVDLAPVAGTVQTASRSQNAPIGALDRDFGLDATGNGQHAAAFVNGMRDAGVMTSIKHFPGLGGVTGNTDFTDSGITDATTTLDGGQIEGFRQALQANPDMVMMSLATYSQIDPNEPAAFSSTILNDYLRGTLGYQGVVTSDSMSAAALGSIPAKELGVRFVSAGGDLICIGANDYVRPILTGLVQKAQSDPAFAQQVDQAALRVLTLKVNAGLAG
ncbi:glycoside hydrolase family 3 N-terminal domain-containing protein [Bifidobacterium callimiconis]|uniref:beta-N-acetylhexosaminidase n=1 Tax=Bifidobacterium callimiconis TaxID=2306973 RepID=A0A430FI72_9BIFI|nr:glycoside hydrolase family 3 N-terminal domain-containing protein [Bifidobacterium callimiconis]RSX52594.1 glycosyl hydrolase, family 3 [Bifidobacterium callimiconis]